MSAFRLPVNSRREAHCFRCSRSSLISLSKANHFQTGHHVGLLLHGQYRSLSVPFRRPSPVFDTLTPCTSVVGPLLLLSEMCGVRPFPGCHSRWSGTPDWPAVMHYLPAPWPTGSSLFLVWPTHAAQYSCQFPAQTCAGGPRP